MVRKVLNISGSRADYGPLRRTLQYIRSCPGLDLSLLVTAMHLDSLHGLTWQEIEADGFKIAGQALGYLGGDSLEAMAGSLGLGMFSMSQLLAVIKPDIVLVLGDRGEQLAAAMAAAFQNIAVVHLCGGSVSGSIDESIRHAITKFAHYHLPACQEDAERIRQMGEDPECIEVVGLPGGDIRPDVVCKREEVVEFLNLPECKPYLLVVQHPVTHNHHQVEAEIVETLEAVACLDYPVLLANPNNDAGGHIILNQMKVFAHQYKHLHILPPLSSREKFASVMACAAAMVGNSSSGLVEAMSIHLPVVNIGNRQQGREHLACTLNVGHQRDQIIEAIQKALFDVHYRQRLEEFHSPLILPDTEERIARVLQNLDLMRGKRGKRFASIHGEKYRQNGPFEPPNNLEAT